MPTTLLTNFPTPHQVVLEYFICWTPLYVVTTWAFIDYASARSHFSPFLKSSFFLLSYLSSCIHPITYCFMNKRFRQSFLAACSCACLGMGGGQVRRDTYTESHHNHTGSHRIARGGGGSSTKSHQFKISWKKSTNRTLVPNS